MFAMLCILQHFVTVYAVATDYIVFVGVFFLSAHDNS